MDIADIGGGDETAEKLRTMRRWLRRHAAAALRLRGSDWFAWATAGVSNVAGPESEAGAAELLVTAEDAYVLIDASEADRLRHEPALRGWTYQVAPWDELLRREHFVLNAADAGVILSDRPTPHERALPCEARAERFVMGPAERLRYRQTGALAAAAMTEAMRAAGPHWSERELAGAAARALWSRGLEPVQVLASGDQSASQSCQALPSDRPLGRRATLSLSARRCGLHATLRRMVAFAPAEGQDDTEILAVESVALDECRDGQPLCAVYKALDGAYALAGQPDAISSRHQGGITGYLNYELKATAHTHLQLKNGMAVAFHPTLRGNVIEDTFLLQEDGAENLTFDPSWPSRLVEGRLRPLCLQAW